MIAQAFRTTDEQSRALEQRVILFLQQRHLVFGCRLWVEAAEGVVTLSGRVPTFHQRQLIYAFTRRVAGVLQVIDLLEVDPPAPPAVALAGGSAAATVLV